MAGQNQETITTFGEVPHSSNISYSQNRSSSHDNRLMIYFQGMKVYIPDNFQPDTLLKLLQTLKKLWWSVLQKEPPGSSLPAEPQIFENRSPDWLLLSVSASNWILIIWKGKQISLYSLTQRNRKDRIKIYQTFPPYTRCSIVL